MKYRHYAPKARVRLVDHPGREYPPAGVGVYRAREGVARQQVSPHSRVRTTLPNMRERFSVSFAIVTMLRSRISTARKCPKRGSGERSWIAYAVQDRSTLYRLQAES